MADLNLDEPSVIPDVNAMDESNNENEFSNQNEGLRILDSLLNNVTPVSEPCPEPLSNTLNETMINSSPQQECESVNECQTEQKEESAKESCHSNDNEEQHIESPTATGEAFVFKCIYCDRNLGPTDNPKLLECLHNACNNCINSKLFENNESSGNTAQEVTCPLCNIQCSSTRIIDNQFLLELSNNDENAVSNESKTTDLKCSSCSDEAPASSYCADCSEFICDNCVQAHQRLKITKDHTIKSKEEAMQELNTASNATPTNLFCSNHPNEKLSLFCETCDKLTCRDCQLIEHREHKYKFTNEIASEAKKFIADMLKDVGYKRALLTSAMKVIDDRQNMITEKKQALVKEITQLVVKLTQTISTRGKQLVGKLTEVCDSKQKTLHEKKQALEQLSKMTDHCIEFTQYALDNGSDMALLYSKKQVTDHLKRIKCKRADIPNPEIPVRIHLALDKVPELVRGLSSVMQTIGQIVVDGRVYPSQTVSPSNLPFPPNQSPSPSSVMRQSPISPLQSPPFQSNQSQPHVVTRIGANVPQPPPPPYPICQNNQGQYCQQNNLGPINNVSPQQFNQNMQNKQPPPPPNMRGPPMQQQGVPITFGHNMNRAPFQRPPQVQKPILPRIQATSSMGYNQQQQQVSSSTHPQGMMQDRSNLRHLLQPNNGPIYIQTGPSQYQAIQPHQFQSRFGSNQPLRFNGQPQLRMIMPNQLNQNRMMMQQQLRPPAQYPPSSGMAAKWHIPQQSINIADDPINPNRSSSTSSLPTINDNFKITLRSLAETNKNAPTAAAAAATVTSTIPKTPSPNHITGHQETERSLDKVCEESVNDLMATIAKLDSNGVQVLAEGRQKGGSPHVDSSTGDSHPVAKIKSELMDTSKDDPNEDWCAVCMDGGELVCCDKCPKVFHQYCHIPNLSVEENDTWQCLLCMNFADIPKEVLSEKKDGELSVKERKIAERLVLELYCQYESSLPFREIISQDNIEYHEIIKKPMALDIIRQKLNWHADNHYTNLEELLKDIRLMFKNAYIFNPIDSQVYADAKTLEKFFDDQLEKFLPQYAYETFENNDDQPPNKKYRRIIND